jgi:hypothetical protein
VVACVHTSSHIVEIGFANLGGLRCLFRFSQARQWCTVLGLGLELGLVRVVESGNGEVRMRMRIGMGLEYG